jgi:hypothetical protein
VPQTKVEEEVVKVRMLVMSALLVAMSAMLGQVRADESNQTVEVRFDHAVQIPGRVLPAGTYWFVLANTDDHQTVQIFNQDRSKSIALLQTMNHERPQATGGVAFTIAERGTTEPPAVIAWFYPGHTTGHEFIYPRSVEKQLALAHQDTQVSGD